MDVPDHRLSATALRFRFIHACRNRMSKSKIVGIAVLVLVGLLVLSFGLGYYELRYKKFFKPRHENVERQVFENTQSYVHGKIQDLARYKVQYDNAETVDGKLVIKNVIVQQFAQFDSEQIVDAGLRNFLVTMRGY